MAMRVLAYSDSRVFGGAEAVFCDMVAGLRRRSSLDLVTAAPATNRRLAEELGGPEGEAQFDVPAQALPLAAFDLHNPRRLRAVQRALARARATVLLVNLPSAEYGPTPLRLDLPVERRVGVLHIVGSPRELDFRLGAPRERLARHALASLDAVCVLSETAAEAFRRQWDNGRATVQIVPLPRPHVEEIPRSQARRKLALDDDGIWIGIAGRISARQKGHDTFIEAAARVSESVRGVRFAVAGDGRDRTRLERLAAARGVAGAIRFLGPVTPIDPFLAAIDAIAIPSRFEGLPLIALESLAAGVPGIASGIDGLRDVWPSEWLVPPGDAGALAEALRVLLQTPQEEREHTLESARRRMESMTTGDAAAALEGVLTA